MSKFLTSGEMAYEIGVCKVTLATYEEKGILIPHHKNAAGHRFYTREQVDEYFEKSKDFGRRVK